MNEENFWTSSVGLAGASLLLAAIHGMLFTPPPYLLIAAAVIYLGCCITSGPKVIDININIEGKE